MLNFSQESVEDYKVEHYKELAKVFKDDKEFSKWTYDYQENVVNGKPIKGFYYNLTDSLTMVQVETSNKVKKDIFKGMCLIESIKTIQNELPF